MNAGLRTAIDAAREANMTKDVIERAILRGAGELPGQQIEELVYECYGPGGVAIMVRCATDNTNRTAGFIKSTLTKFGGNLGGPGSVSFLFKQKGVIRSSDASDDTQLKAMDAGADDLVEEEGGLTIYTKPTQFESVKTALGTAVTYAEVSLTPETRVQVDATHQNQFEKLLDTLEESEDVVDVTHNAQ